MSTGQQKKARFSTSLALVIIGIVAWIVGASYAAYQKYSVGHSFAHSVSNPVVVALGILGLILIVAGVYLNRKKAPMSKKTGTSSDAGASSGK